MAYKQGFLFEKTKEPDKFKEIYKKMEQIKLLKALDNYPKLKVIINLNNFNDVEKIDEK